MNTEGQDQKSANGAGAQASGTVNRTARSHRLLVSLSPCLVLLAGIAVAAWWWLRAPTVDPPMPPNVHDPEVLQILETARREVRDHPRSASAWGQLGMKLLAHLCCPEATRCFIEAARLDPDDARWPYLRANIAARLDPDPDNVLPLLRQAANGHAAPAALAAVRLCLAETLVERQEWDEAETLFRAHLREEPNSPRAAFGLGIIAHARGNDGEAEQFLALALRSDSAEKKATALLAACARGRGDVATANRYEERYAELPDDVPWPDPFLPPVFSQGVGRRFRALEVENLELDHRFAEAAALYLERAEREPTAAAYTGAGVNLARAGDLDQAVLLLRQAVRLDARDSNAQYRLAQSLYTRAEQRPPNSAKAQTDFREAAAAAQQATVSKPDHAAAYLIQGRALLKQGKPVEAIEPLRKGVACRPERFDLQLALGEALLEAGRPEEAATHLENARKLNPQDARPTQALEQVRKNKSPS